VKRKKETTETRNIMYSDKTRGILPTVFAYLAFVIALIGLVIATLAYIQKPNINNTVNLAAVPGQTDATGDFTITGQLRLPGLTPSTSSTTGGLVVQGGIGCNETVHAKDGVITNYVAPESGILNLGTQNQTGIVLGRSGFPVEVQANQLIVECESKTQTLSPAQTNVYDLGQASAQWRDIYVCGNVYNTTLFPTKVSGGIFSQLDDSFPLIEIINPPGSLIGFDAIFSTPTANAFPADSLVAGDTIKFFVAGDLTVNVTATTLDFAVFIGNTALNPVSLVLSGITTPTTKNFVFTATITVRQSGNPGALIGVNQIEWGAFKNQSIGTLAANTFSEVNWDVRVSSNSPGIGVSPGSIKSRIVNVSKIF
jgi:hypothetical protein